MAVTISGCGAEREGLKLFMLWSPAYTQEGMKSERLQQPYPEEDDVIGKYLVGQNAKTWSTLCYGAPPTPMKEWKVKDCSNYTKMMWLEST